MSYVLIIDNDDTLRSVLAQELKKIGIPVQEAGDGQAGLAKAKAAHPAVIILDEHMPKMDGQHFVEALRQEDWFDDVHIIVFTALHDIDLMNHKMLAGVSDYLNKSTCTPQTVVEAVEKYFPSPAASGEQPRPRA